MIRVPGHVLDVAVQAHAGIEKHGDGRPGAVREAGPEKAVHGDAGFPQARCVRDADHAAMPEKVQRRISLIGPGPHGPGAPPVLPARGPQVQQLHQIGFGGFLRGVSAGQFHFLHCQHLSLQTRMALKHHAAPQFFWISKPPSEGAPRRPPAATRSATRPRTGESPISECALPRL